MNASRIDLAYDLVEDRILLTAFGPGDQHVPLCMTRRFTRSFLGKLAETLLKTNGDVSRAASDHREEVFLFEHMNALSSTEFSSSQEGEQQAAAASNPDSGSGEEQAAVAVQAKPGLITRVDVTIRTEGFIMNLFELDVSRATIGLSRPEAHRILDLMLRKARTAGWDLDELNWIDRRRHIVVPESMSLS